MIESDPSATELYWQKKDAVAEIVINRPGKRNAFNAAMWERLGTICNEIAEDTDVRSTILRSASDEMFCAGADISEFGAIQASEATARANVALIRQSTMALHHLPRPTIATISGDCFGGGTLLALCCDFRIAEAGSSFAITPARLGLSYSVYDVNTLVRTVGYSLARRLLLLGETINAHEALKHGLVDQVADSQADREAKIMAMTDRFSKLSQFSLRTIKTNMLTVMSGQADDDDRSVEALVDAFDGEDLAEGVSAFLEKRAPDFPFA